MTIGDKTVKILLVEDDEVDAEGIERSFRKAKIANPVIRARDGVEALERLRGSSEEPPLAQPFLVLLDLNMPRMDGLTFLDNIRKDPAIQNAIVFVLTTSSAEKDKFAAYKSFVAGYIVKSRAGVDFVELIGLLDHYWRVVEFPPEGV